MKSSKILILFAFLLSSSCINNENSRFNAGYEKGLNIARNGFSEDYLDHFPTKVTNKYLLRNVFPQNDQYTTYYGSVLLLKSSSSQIQSLKFNDLFVENELFRYFDDCAVILTRQSKSINERSSNCIAPLPPIPDFSQFIDNAAQIEIYLNDFKIHVLESESGECIEVNYLSENLCMHEEWLH